MPAAGREWMARVDYPACRRGEPRAAGGTGRHANTGRGSKDPLSTLPAQPARSQPSMAVA